MTRAILLSGGMDSFSLAYQEKPEIAVTIDYGQKPAARELEVSALLADRLAIKYFPVTVDLSSLGSGDLCSRPALSNAPATDWWPYRNQALITIAAMAVISEGIEELLIATVKSDEIHKDGTTSFVSRVSELLEMQEGGMKVSAPAIDGSTADLVKSSNIPIGLLAWSHSCHTSNMACGNCRGCWKRSAVWQELGVSDAGV